MLKHSGESKKHSGECRRIPGNPKNIPGNVEGFRGIQKNIPRNVEAFRGIQKTLRGMLKDSGESKKHSGECRSIPRSHSPFPIPRSPVPRSPFPLLKIAGIN